MIAPGALVILTPVVVGTLFGTRTLSGLLAGSLVSGVQMAVSMSNTGGAWDNAKKYVEVSSWRRADLASAYSPEARPLEPPTLPMRVMMACHAALNHSLKHASFILDHLRTVCLASAVGRRQRARAHAGRQGL